MVCKTRLIAKAQQTGVAANTANLARCETKFASSCAKAQGKGDCAAQTASCAAIEVTADACVDSLSGAFVLAQSSCDAGITKAAGRKVGCKLKVIAKAQKTGAAVDTVKLAKCETKFTSSCTTAQGRGDCTAQTPGPDRLIADRAYDSNPLRARLARRGIEPRFPALPNHPNATHQDGRKLRRYRRRWIVERTFAWLGAFRRLVVRYERLLLTYAGFFHLACAMLTLRRVLK